MNKLEWIIQNISIKCKFKTTGNNIVNWSRTIKNRKDYFEYLELVDNFEKKKIVKGSTSNWLNQVVLKRKKNGNLRFCVDFRQLNDIIDLDGYSIPNIQEMISKLNDQKFFSILNLEDNFFKIDIEPENNEKTTFFTGKKLMQFTKMFEMI